MKIFKYILLVNLAVVAVSCQKLDENPKSIITPGNFYKTKNDALAAITGVYAPIRLNGYVARNYVILGDITTDNMFPLNNSAPRIDLNTYRHNSQNGILLETWNNFYFGITRANAAINNIPKVDMEEGLKNRLIAEAKFLRAFYYYHLVRLFGDLPIVTAEVTKLEEVTYPKRDPKAEVYKQIIADFKDAEAVLPETYAAEDNARATKGAATAFLASVYLTLKDYSTAAAKANEIMDKYELWDSYDQVFLIANKYKKEYIFDAPFKGNSTGQGGNLIAFFAQENNSVGGRGFGSFQPTVEVYNSYSANDKRKEVFFTKGTDNKYYVNKWVDPSAKDENQSSNNYPLMRFAEVVLTYAEAYNEVNVPENDNAAYKAVNRIRKRAGLPDLKDLTQDQLRDAILQERRLELAFEGSRWFDLVRTGKLVSTLSAKGITNVRDYHNVFPIPQLPMDINPNLAPQNPGYGK